MPVAEAGPEAASPPDPRTLLRSREYLVLLVPAALIGVPVSAAAFGFLALVGELQPLIYPDLPKSLGFDGTPAWWPLPLLAAFIRTGWCVRLGPGAGWESGVMKRNIMNECHESGLRLSVARRILESRANHAGRHLAGTSFPRHR